MPAHHHQRKTKQTKQKKSGWFSLVVVILKRNNGTKNAIDTLAVNSMTSMFCSSYSQGHSADVLKLLQGGGEGRKQQNML